MEQGQGQTANTFEGIAEKVDFNHEKESSLGEKSVAELGVDTISQGGGQVQSVPGLGQASLDAASFGNLPQPPMGEIVDLPDRAKAEITGEKVIGTDLPKAADRDGLEPQIMDRMEEIMHESDLGKRAIDAIELGKTLRRDRYGTANGLGSVEDAS